MKGRMQQRNPGCSCRPDSSAAWGPLTNPDYSLNGRGRPVSSWAHGSSVSSNSCVARQSSQLATPTGLYFSPDRRGGTTRLAASSSPTHLRQRGLCRLDSSAACGPSTDSDNHPNGHGRPVSSWAHGSLVFSNSYVARRSSQLASPAGLYFSPDWRGGTTSLVTSS